MEQKTLDMFKEICNKVTENGWKYSEDADQLAVTFTAKKDNEPMWFRMKIDEKSKLLKILSYIDINIPENKREDFAYIICAVNNRIIDGNFDYDSKIGHLIFRMSNNYAETETNTNIIEYMLDCAISIVDKYSALLRAFTEGVITVEEFFSVDFKTPDNNIAPDHENNAVAFQIYQMTKEYVTKCDIEIIPLNDLSFKFTIQGTYMEIPIIVSIDPIRELLKINSPMIFTISPQSRRSCALAVCSANFGMSDGCFEYNAENGFLGFRTEISYANYSIGESHLDFLFNETISVVDEYNDKFLVFGV